MKRRHFVSACGSVWLAASAGAAAPASARNYAVVSLMGDKLNLVGHRMSTGSHLDRNSHESFAVSGGVFDQAAMVAAHEGLKRADADATVHVFAAGSGGELFDNQGRFFDGAKVSLPPVLATPLDQDGATHLLLITKHRGEARLKTADGNSLGSGKLEGVGFYIDRTKRMRRSDTGEASSGFLAPFVYIKLCLIDLKTSTVLHEQSVIASSTLSTARAKEGMDPWDVLSATEKVDTLRGMIHDEVSRVATELARS